MNRRALVEPILLKLRAAPFSWGDVDCGLGLAAPVILAVTGKDLGAPFRGTYSTSLGAMKVLRQHGFETVADVVGAAFPRVHIARAQYADIAVLEGENTGVGLGVVIGERIACMTPTGYGTIERCKAKWAHRIA